MKNEMNQFDGFFFVILLEDIKMKFREIHLGILLLDFTSFFGQNYF